MTSTLLVYLIQPHGFQVHMVIGTGGASFTMNAYGAPYNEFTAYEWGYARMTAHNGSFLTWEFLDTQRGVRCKAPYASFQSSLFFL
jgi:hypothetical protein